MWFIIPPIPPIPRDIVYVFLLWCLHAMPLTYRLIRLPIIVAPWYALWYYPLLSVHLSYPFHVLPMWFPSFSPRYPLGVPCYTPRWSCTRGGYPWVHSAYLSSHPATPAPSGLLTFVYLSPTGVRPPPSVPEVPTMFYTILFFSAVIVLLLLCIAFGMWVNRTYGYYVWCRTLVTDPLRMLRACRCHVLSTTGASGGSFTIHPTASGLDLSSTSLGVDIGMTVSSGMGDTLPIMFPYMPLGEFNRRYPWWFLIRRYTLTPVFFVGHGYAMGIPWVVLRGCPTGLSYGVVGCRAVLTHAHTWVLRCRRHHDTSPP